MATEMFWGILMPSILIYSLHLELFHLEHTQTVLPRTLLSFKGYPKGYMHPFYKTVFSFWSQRLPAFCNPLYWRDPYCYDCSVPGCCTDIIWFRIFMPQGILTRRTQCICRCTLRCPWRLWRNTRSRWTWVRGTGSYPRKTKPCWRQEVTCMN